MNPNDNRLDVLTYQGVPFSDAITLEDSAGAVYPLTGRLVTANVWDGSPDAPGEIVLAVTEAASLIARNTVTGVVTRTLTAAAMAALAVGDYWYELVVTTTGGTVVDRPCWGFHQHLPSGVGVVADE